MQLVEYLARTDECLSRTQKLGLVDTGVSPNKRSLNLDREFLLMTMERNRNQVATYITRRASRPPACEGEFLTCLMTIAEIYSQDLLPATIFRTCMSLSAVSDRMAAAMSSEVLR